MILFFSIWCGMKSWGMESTIISIGPLKRYVLTSTTVKRALVVGPLICYFLQLFLPRIIILYWFRFCSVLLPLLPLFSPLSFFSSFLQSINLTIVNLRKKGFQKLFWTRLIWENRSRICCLGIRLLSCIYWIRVFR